MFLKNKNIIFKIRRSKVTDYAALMISVFKLILCVGASSMYMVWRVSHSNCAVISRMKVELAVLLF